MRRFADRDGRQWDVILGRESWGALLALFAPVGHDARTLQAPLRADSVLDAELELDRLTDERLQQMLDHAQPKDG